MTAIGCNILAKYNCEEHVSHEISNIIKLSFTLTLILSRVRGAGMLLSACSASCQSGLYVLAPEGLQRLVYSYSMGNVEHIMAHAKLWKPPAQQTEH